MVFFGEVEAMVRDEDDDGVVLLGALCQGIEDAAVLDVDLGGCGEVGLHCGFVKTGFEN